MVGNLRAKYCIGWLPWMLFMVLAVPSVAQQNAPPAAPQNLPQSDQVLQVFRDAYGREMEEVLVTRQVSEYRTEMKEIKETRVVQDWVTENQTNTQVQYTPQTQYQMQPRWIGRYNPFVQPTLTYDYVPVTTYQPNPVTTQGQVTIPKWVTKEVPVLVPQVVPTTRTVQYRVVRPRLQSQGNGSVAANPLPARPNPSQTAANIAMLDRTALNPAASPIVASPPAVSASVASYGYPTAVPLGQVGPQPLINPSRFLQGGRLVNTSNPNGWSPPPASSPMINSLPIPAASSPVLPTQRPLFANSLLRPSTAPTYSLPRTAAIPGSAIWREPSQLGIRPTELR